MKTTLAFLAAVAGIASAQNFEGVPECAVTCITEALPQVGCEVTDQACQCREDTQTALIPIITPCIISSCSADELSAAAEAGTALCADFSATPSDSEASSTETVTTDGVSTEESITTSEETTMTTEEAAMTTEEATTMVTEIGTTSPVATNATTPTTTDVPPTAGAAHVAAAGLLAVAGAVFAL